MKLLLDTHLILWTAADATELPDRARILIEDPAHTLLFSVASLWEIVIKRGLDRADFQVEPHVLRRNLLDAGYVELPITSAHVLAVEQLPPVHRDPFDRLLIAQAISEGVTLLTHDHTVARYPGPILHV
ncbi:MULTISPECIES: type II toxin-antitoxin system VapC family toxin [Burkholderia]|uniref:Twitching motility protein PilT n=2 Tax=Bacteria TaxID=2 RepID=A0A1V2W2V6_9BURK|nr:MULTISPECIES: type II toxin-antitoxin system VapC family toxin [Burkholderia]MDP9549023.1 PIN domain nuclease of toxin-antitoxin system [Burkholderia cepacia]MBJ9694612.1 type II toxin-antitoxin system VapC family toxin [Burkholderia cenocepacia]MBR8251446.1 type II toxin-antitoxin system VapC family toxin [Burkholderia cenocepacia]MBR8271994.1 type II toxin-antitoxin system VapC family toxin [Burkholderia cenocepacia]MBR8292136.1 type II toxin-antitoxin system VapC family toxin [Burkholder